MRKGQTRIASVRRSRVTEVNEYVKLKNSIRNSIMVKMFPHNLFDFAHPQIAFSAIIGKGYIGVFGEEQHGFLVKLESLPQIMGIGFGDTTTFATGFGRDGG